MKSLQQYLKTTIVLVAIFQIDAKRDFSMEIMDVSFTIIDSDLLKSVNHKIYDHKKVYVDMFLNKDISAFDVKLSIDFIKGDKSRISFLKTTVNGCESLENAQKTSFLNMIFQEVFRVANLPKKCPLLANTLYTFNNYTLRDDDFPITLPILDWQIKADFVVDKKVACKAVASGRVRKL